MIASEAALCVITPTYEDSHALVKTLMSLREELEVYDELVVVDSSADRNHVPTLVDSIGLKCSVKVIWQSPAGVYSALNSGIRVSTRPWLQVLNSGDQMCRGARGEIRKAISADAMTSIHVFSQRAGSEGEAGYVFKPNSSSVWPHQSVVLRAIVHETLGAYETGLRFVSDQVFFAKARKSFKCKLHEFVLTSYDLHGMSSVVSWRLSGEVWIMWRSLGRGPLEAFWRAWVKPWARMLTERLLGHEVAVRVKIVMTSDYQQDGKRGY